MKRGTFMLEYKPWAEEILTPIVEKSDEKLPILDIQLGVLVILVVSIVILLSTVLHVM